MSLPTEDVRLGSSLLGDDTQNRATPLASSAGQPPFHGKLTTTGLLCGSTFRPRTGRSTRQGAGLRAPK